MAKDNDPIRLSPIALRMREDLQLSGKGDRTQESYIRMLRKFTEFLKNEPDSATESDLRNYLLHIKNQRQWSNSTINVAYCSLKFFFSKTCPRDWPTLKKLKVQTEPRLRLPMSRSRFAQRVEFVQADASECRGIHTSVLATCASERFSKSPSLRLRPSASQDELGVVVDVGNGDTEHGVRADCDDQAADGEANVEMSGMRW